MGVEEGGRILLDEDELAVDGCNARIDLGGRRGVDEELAQRGDLLDEPAAVAPVRAVGDGREADGDALGPGRHEQSCDRLDRAGLVGSYLKGRVAERAGHVDDEQRGPLAEADPGPEPPLAVEGLRPRAQARSLLPA